MKHQGLEKKLCDWAYQRRFAQNYVPHLLMLLPLGVYIGVSYWELGYFPPRAIIFTAGTYALVNIVLVWQAGRAALRGLRQEGIVDVDYRPPEF